MDSSFYIEFYSKINEQYTSFKILDLGYDRVEDAKDVLEIPGNRLVIFSYKYYSLLVFDINTNELLFKKYVNYSISNIMSDLIENKYIFVGTKDGMLVYDIENDFCQTLYKYISTPYYITKINTYEYFFIKENLIQIVKFKDKKFEIITSINFKIKENCQYDSHVYKIDDFKFIIEIVEKESSKFSYFIIFNKVK